MANLEDAIKSDGDWGGIEQLTPGTRIGYGQNYIFIEKNIGPDANGDMQVGVYNLPHVPADRMADFLVWLGSLK